MDHLTHLSMFLTQLDITAATYRARPNCLKLKLEDK